jgi:hypothetical protein
VLFLRGKSGWGVKLITHLHHMPKLILHGVITSRLHGVVLKHRDNVYLQLTDSTEQTVFFNKPIVARLVNKLLAFYGTRGLIGVFTKVSHRIVSRAR